jgi:hypothetical protein
MAVTVDDVKAIYPTNQTLTGYLTTANVIKNTQLLDKGLDPTQLDQVTIYLAAHFAVIGLEQGGLRRKRMGEADESYKTPGDFDVGFASTRFGQMAMLLDTSGTLAGMASNNKLPALFQVVGDGSVEYSG